MDVSVIAAEKGVPLTKIGVIRGPKGYGTVDPDGDPWAAKMVGKRCDWLDKQFKKLELLHKSGNTEEYEKEVRFFYDRARETWERLIEEKLFAQVVVRFRRGVETKRLRSAVVNNDLFSQIYNGMTAISEFTAHDKPAAAGGSLPEPSTIKIHLGELKTCIEAIEKEAKAVEKEREKLEKAPKPSAA
jgi:hypothetical protein